MSTPTAQVPEVPQGEMTWSEAARVNMRALSAMHGLTQHQLAAQLGMSRGAVADKLGGRSAWTLDEMQKAARLFRVEPLELLVRPKGFEPLTFWFGAGGVTMWPVGATSWAAFCDACGATWAPVADLRVVGSGLSESAAAHTSTRHGIVLDAWQALVDGGSTSSRPPAA